MNNETIDFKDVKREYRKRKVKETIDNGIRKVRENREIIVPIVMGAGTVITGTTRIVSKMIQNHTVNKELDFKRRTIYDRSLGRYVELRKPLTNAQALTIEERRENGEKLHVILDSMGLLKK